jgi:ribosomal protein S12 methylthiotransferase accessory factor YcaO
LHMGTHSNIDIAIIRALTEIIQNRATNLDNNKFNITMLSEKDYLNEKSISPITAHYLELFRNNKAEVISYSDIKNTDVDDMKIELDNLVALLDKK